MGSGNTRAVFYAVFADHRQDNRFAPVIHHHPVSGFVFFLHIKLREACLLSQSCRLSRSLPLGFAFVQEFFVRLAKGVGLLQLAVADLSGAAFFVNKEGLFQLFH